MHAPGTAGGALPPLSLPGPARPTRIGISALLAGRDLDQADDVPVGVNDVGLLPSDTDGHDWPSDDPPNRKVMDETIEVADRDRHDRAPCALSVPDYVEPAAPGYLPHDLVLVRNNVSGASEQSLVPGHASL